MKQTRAGNIVRIALRLLGYQLVFGFISFMIMPALMDANPAIRILLAGVIVAAACLFTFLDGTYQGERDVAMSRRLSKLEAKGVYTPDKEENAVANVIIVGCGRVGSQLATMLSENNANVCVVDRKAEALSNIVLVDKEDKKTGKILFGEIKRQDGWVEGKDPSAGRGTAHERMCKLFTPGLMKAYRKIGKIDDTSILPFWVVLEGDITRDPKRNREIAFWFDENEKI